jgi:hypothetical protein
MAHQVAYPAAAAGKRRGNKAAASNVVTASRRLLVAAAVLFGAGLFAPPAQAQSGPFAGLEGRWSGGGTVTLDNGSTERIRCRAAYGVSGPELGLTLTCASDSYKFNLEGRAVAEPGGEISGTWSESSRNVTGNLQGRGRNGNFELVASGPGFNSSISLTTRGNRQSIVMRADSQFRGATISMSR